MITKSRLITIVSLICIFLCACACEKTFLQKTAVGSRILAFTFDGSVARSRTLRPSAFAYKTEDELLVEAWVGHGIAYSVKLTIPSASAGEGVTLSPEVEFEYIYRRKGGYDITREATVDAATMYIRRLDYEKRIFAGDFTMKGSYIDSTGVVHRFNVTDGVFDLVLKDL